MCVRLGFQAVGGIVTLTKVHRWTNYAAFGLDHNLSVLTLSIGFSIHGNEARELKRYRKFSGKSLGANVVAKSLRRINK
jgi:hypothetical protein